MKLQLINKFILSAIIILMPMSNIYSAQYSLHKQKLELLEDSNWESVLPNRNNLIFQKTKKSQNPYPVLFVSSTQIEDVKFNTTGLQVRIDSYTEGRVKYINAKGGQLIRFIPYSKSVQSEGTEDHLAGVDYQIGDEIYHERTRFVSCYGSVLHVKSLDFSHPEKVGSAYLFGRTLKCLK